MANFGINRAGLIVAARFALIWIIAFATWHYGRVEARWTPTTVSSKTKS
jgi:hypothetical protein